jgi:flavin reductase (DIM6/NTAB) family NADH-FMN oxidoreductase RutF
MDYCGTRSGRDVNKWEELNLTKEKGTVVEVPLVKEFPWNMECKVIKRIELGSHVCYLGEVVATHSDQEYVTNNALDPNKINTFAYISGNYIRLKKGLLERHGFSFS